MTDKIKPKYINWYEETFQAEPRVRHMKPIQRHFYRALLIQAFYCSTRPYLPDDDAELWILADAESEEQWMEHAKVVRRMYEPVVIEGVKLLSQKRLLKEWDTMVSIFSGKGRGGEGRTPVAPPPTPEQKQTRTDLNRPEPNTSYLSGEGANLNTASEQASASGGSAPLLSKKRKADVRSVQVGSTPAAHSSTEQDNPIGSGKAVYAQPTSAFEEEEEGISEGVDSETLVDRFWSIAKKKTHMGSRSATDDLTAMRMMVQIHGVNKITLCLDQLARSDYWGITDGGKIDGIRGFGKALEAIHGQAMKYLEKVKATAASRRK